MAIPPIRFRRASAERLFACVTAAVLAALSILASVALPAQASAARRFEVSFPESLRREAVTGRLIVVVTRADSPEPRLTISPYGPPIFGADVEKLRPGSVSTIDEKSPGYPLPSLDDLPAGDYFAQAVLNGYTECRRSDGRTIWGPPRPQHRCSVQPFAREHVQRPPEDPPRTRSRLGREAQAQSCPP